MADKIKVFSIEYGGEIKHFISHHKDVDELLRCGLSEKAYDALTGKAERISEMQAAEIEQGKELDCSLDFNYDSKKIKVFTSSGDLFVLGIAELNDVVKALDEFCEGEYDEQACFNDLRKVGIAYTTITDYEIPIQVFADLTEFQITYMLGEFNGIVAKEDQFNHLYELADDIRNSTFDDYVSVYDKIGRDAIGRYLTEDGYKRELVSDGNREVNHFLIDKWEDNGLAGEMPTEFTLVADEYADEYTAQANIKDGEFKGRYLIDYNHRPTKEQVFSDFTDKIAELAIDANERRAYPFRDDEELDLTQEQERGR